MKWGINSDDAIEGGPIELKFVDMFMACIGCLIFIAMVLAMVPRAGYVKVKAVEDLNAQVAQLSKRLGAEEEQLASVRRENAKLLAELRCEDSSCLPLGKSLNASEEKWFYANITTLWIQIQILMQGCAGGNPEMYVRHTGPIFNEKTSMRIDDAKEFDMSEINNSKTILNGEKYVHQDVGNGESTETYNGFIFNDPAFLYVGLGEIEGQGEAKCVIIPKFDTLWSNGQDEGENRKQIYTVLSKTHPYAVIAKMQVNEQGKIIISFPQGNDKVWNQELKKLDALENFKLKRPLADRVSAAKLLVADSK